MVPKPMSVFIVILAIFTLAAVAAPPGATPALAGQEDVALFQEALSGLGQWFNYGQQGSVWQPRQVDRNWRPYTNGRWVPTQEGYVFETDEPWGWATYHYGNWMPTKEHGWVWAPGRTWYPHTVNWRSSDQNVGWAPVPPPENAASDNYYGGSYADNSYAPATGLNSYGSSLNGISPTSWIFTQASDFLLGYGQPYASSYSYANAGVLAAPQYISTIYERTVYVNNYVCPSYAPRACYNWGPPVTYVTKVTNIRNIEIDQRCKNLRLAQLRNVMPPANLARRHPAWREILPAAGETRQRHIRSVANIRTAAGGLNRPDAIPAPASLNRRPLAGDGQNSGQDHLRPQSPLASANGQLASPGGRAEPNNWRRPSGPNQVSRPTEPVSPREPHASRLVDANRPSGRQAARINEPPAVNPTAQTATPPGNSGNQPTAMVPPYRQGNPRRVYQSEEPQASRDNQLRRYQGRRLPEDQQQAAQELSRRQQQRLEMERRQQQAQACQSQEQQARRQQQLQADQQRRQAEMQRYQQMQQQRQQQMQQHQAQMQQAQQMQQQRQAEMQRAQQMHQQQIVRQAPPPPQRQAPAPQRHKRQDNQNQ